MRACWSMNFTNRPAASEIVDFLTDNPHIISPCLDVPLTSTKFEPPAEMHLIELSTPKLFDGPSRWQSSGDSLGLDCSPKSRVKIVIPQIFETAENLKPLLSIIDDYGNKRVRFYSGDLRLIEDTAMIESRENVQSINRDAC